MFPIRLKELRKLKGFSQSELAKYVNVSQQTIGSWEVGRSEPNIETLQRLASLFGVTVDYLLGKNQTPKWANEKDTNDLQRFLSDNEGSMTYGGEDLTEEEKEKLKIAMTQIFWSRHKHD
ncbi:helix-turn-helix transcriptional regulator [Secundilactobacillus kimchicus]|uniref:helix-turn-helix transcriptional regulator n=1 Tax=Secundilactobacillus kimchicus TaxID=528209 RepID=UPI0024A7ED94|nr:helix-turn-helix transcriptional regulator [Secundilactobacillus kimchicus]